MNLDSAKEGKKRGSTKKRDDTASCEKEKAALEYEA